MKHRSKLVSLVWMTVFASLTLMLFAGMVTWVTTTAGGAIWLNDMLTGVVGSELRVYACLGGMHA